MGGFSVVPICKDNNKYNDQTLKSFMFSLSLNKKFKLKNKDVPSIYTYQEGPSFGNNTDLLIRDNCNNINGNRAFSNAILSYELT